MAEIWSPELTSFRWVNMHHWISFVCGPKFNKFFSPNVEWGCSWSSFVPIFDISILSGGIRDQVERWQKSCRNLDVFWPSQYLGGGPSKSCTHIITPALRHVVWKKFRQDTFTGPEVIGAHTLNLGGSICTTGSLLFFDQSSPSFFAQRGSGCGWRAFLRFSICRSLPEIFAIKVGCCKNRAEIWTVFWPSQNLGGGPFKSCTHIITPASRHVVWKKFREDTPTGPEVIGVRTLNFRPNFKFSPLIFFFGGGPRPRWGVRYVAWINL